MVNEKAKKYGGQGSAIRTLFEYGKKRKKIVGPENVFDFSIGNPSTPAPKEFNETLIKIINECDPVLLHSYTSAIGEAKAREAIVDNLNKRYDAGLDRHYVYITCGAAAGLTITLKAIATSEDDEAIVFAPFFPEYTVFIENAGLKEVIVNPDENMLPDFVDLENKITEKTRVIIMDSPNNPTGVVYGEEVIQKLADLLNKKQKEYGHEIFLISDEPYRELNFSGKKYPFVTRYYDNSVVVYSFSKSLSLPGERIGYIAVNPKSEHVVDLFNAINGAGRLMGFVNAPALFQHALPYVIDMVSNFDDYLVNRELLYKGLTELGYEVIYPEGAFYMFVKSLEEDDFKFSSRAKDFDILVAPSTPFGVKGYVRIAYCCSTEQIKNSMKAFKALKESYER
ncbi:MAG: pyridoxal phosphate-dependent aminotransferase [Bacilli bacterium]|nr:pyridoxal phosphate-dependent aminotransferase [Bacilli bacterium]